MLTIGLRFRKSIKICKGVRVNFSKSGVSYSFGGKGATFNVGKKGTRATFGIPGTGLSYSQNLGSGPKATNHTASTSANTHPNASKTDIVLQMDNDGKIKYSYADGREITDAALIRKIKATQQYQSEVARLDAIRHQEISKILQEKHAANEEFLNLHRLSPKVSTQQDFDTWASTIVPQKYTPRAFGHAYPTEATVRQLLEVEAKTAVKTQALWKIKALQKEYVNTQLPGRLIYLQQQWNAARQAFETNEAQYAQQQNDILRKEYVATKQAILLKINGEENFINQIIESWIAECSLPVDININYLYTQANHSLYIDLDLPEIEDLPDTELTQAANGNLKEKKKTQQKLRQEYATLVFGVSIFIAANLMNLSPAIHHVILSGYTQRRDSSGNLNNDYILSVKFKREILEKTTFQNVNPVEFCMQFENRCNMTSTMLFKTIEPYSTLQASLYVIFMQIRKNSFIRL